MNLEISSSTLKSLQRRTYTIAELARRRGLSYSSASTAFKKYGILLRRGRRPFSPRRGGSIKLFRRYYNEVRGPNAWQNFLKQSKHLSLSDLGYMHGFTASRAGELRHLLTGEIKKKVYKLKPPRISKDILKNSIKGSCSKTEVARKLGISHDVVTRDAAYWKLKVPNGSKIFRRRGLDRELICNVKQSCFNITDLVRALSTDRNTLFRRHSAKEWRELKRYFSRKRRKQGRKG